MGNSAFCCVSRDKDDGWRMPGVKVVHYGVLGNSSLSPLVGAVAPEPDDDTVFVDPAGMHHIQNTTGGPSGASGASGAIYKWLGINTMKKFPKAVREAITVPLMAKHSPYRTGHNKLRHCIHVVGVDFRKQPNTTREQAVSQLAEAYHNVFVQFVQSKLRRLRLLPISGGVFSGAWDKDMDAFALVTADAVEQGFRQLLPDEQSYVLDAEEEMCVYMHDQVESFVCAFRERGSFK